MRVTRRQLIWSASGLVALVAFYVVVVFAVWFLNKDVISPGVTVAGVNLGGKTKAQAQALLQSKVDALKIAEGPGIGLKFDIPRTAERAFEAKKNRPFDWGPKAVPASFEYDQQKLYDYLKKEESKQLSSVINPRATTQSDELVLVGGKDGQRLNYAQTEYRFNQSLANLTSKVDLIFYRVSPSFSKEEIARQEDLYDEVLPLELTFKGNGQDFKLTKNEMLSWVKLPVFTNSASRIFGGEELFAPLFGSAQAGYYDSSEIEVYLKSLSSKIDRTPQNAVLGAAEGKVVVSRPEVLGAKLDVPESIIKVTEALEKQEKAAELQISVTTPEITAEKLNQLGLVELISTGYSNFAGSPVNRIHNVKTGASKFNGVLVKPGADFSFNTILGPVDASTGYLPELVILENKTQPQFGGGLCQVSSTAFRAALNAGFPIVERRAHAYPVSYYKPFGVDATIYLPKPDLRFKNNSSGYLFVQTRIVGKNLYFDFYGTKSSNRVAFAGGENANGAVPIVEKVSPYVYDQGVRGKGSFSAIFYRFIYDQSGKLLESKKFLSKYDSPDKYPH